MEYLPLVIPIGNKPSSSSAIAANQVRFTATTKHTASAIGSAVAGTGVGSVGGNSMGFGKENGIGSGDKNDVGSNGNNSIGSGAEVNVGNNPENAIVCLGILSATAIDPAFSWFNVAVLTSSTAGYDHLTPLSSVVQMGWAIKPPVLLF